DFAGLSRLQAFHSRRKILHRDAVCNHRVQIELAVLKQRCHLIPGLIHAPAVDSLDGDALKNNVLGKVKRDWLGSEAEEGNAPTAPYDVERGSNGVGMLGHFEDCI